MSIQFSTQREDFPPNLDSLDIQQILLYIVQSDDAVSPEEMTDMVELQFKDQASPIREGGKATLMRDGVISTRRSNGAPWVSMIGKSPIGTWDLDFSGSEILKSWLQNDHVEDIIFILTFEGETPDWLV